ncbi:hypothetical protein PR003_g26279, partial [Phytophthora rubi]
LQLRPDKVTFRAFEGLEGCIDRSVAEEHVVRASEVNQAGQQSFLRRPVSVRVADQVHHGQVVAVSAERLTVQSEGQLLPVKATEVTLVAPVVALLLEHIQFNSSEWSADDIGEVEQTILDRVLGRSGTPSSNAISALFEGLVDEKNYPEATKLCHWIDPRTGEPTEFPLQHAINFAYYVGGGVSPIPVDVGESFCRQPVPQRMPSPAGGSLGSAHEVQELFDPFTDDDVSPHDTHQPRQGLGYVPLSGTKRPQVLEVDDDDLSNKRKRFETALDKDARIVDKLFDDPDLLNHLLRIRKDSKSQDATEEQDTHIRSDPDKDVKSATRKKSAVASKYAFVPLEDQEVVHDRVTSEKYKGKSPIMFCRGLVRSEHAEFKAVPGVCTRAYDIRFGSGGLSIQHVAKFPRDERMNWLASGGSNFDNLSANAEFGAASPASCIGDVIDACRVFLTYTREFCCKELIELVERIVKFIEETLKQVSWHPKELASLVYWVNDVLEDFRDSAEAGRDLRLVLNRCTTDDRLLRDMMFIKMHKQVDDIRLEMTASAPRAGGSRNIVPQRHQGQIHDHKKGIGRIPKDVLRQLPVQVDPGTGKARNLCMRYLSQAGCTVNSNGTCPNGHGHFVPNTLSDIVKVEITKRFGGLKEEHMQL